MNKNPTPEKLKTKSLDEIEVKYFGKKGTAKRDHYEKQVEIEVEKNERALKKKYAHLPITWPTGKPDIKDFVGLWGKRKVTLKEIRDKAWGRK